MHIAGEDAPEMVQLAAVAVKAGLTKKQWDTTVALHPTAAEELVLMRETRAGALRKVSAGTARARDMSSSARASSSKDFAIAT